MINKRYYADPISMHFAMIYDQGVTYLAYINVLLNQHRKRDYGSYTLTVAIWPQAFDI